ncbi:hypothetical protein BBJ28_00010293 [Nothophytophthora sp. Chile5]|nr:hypothetical protein BBJ28_00010293 [Nothophytophthora sp. Chile5]
MIRPLITTSVVVVEKRAPKRRKKNDEASVVDASKKTRAKAPEDLVEQDNLAKELFKLGPEYSADVLIGIDPGMRSLVTAITVGRLPCRRRPKCIGRQWRRSTRKPRREQRCIKGPVRRPQRITEISTRKYRHMTRKNDFRFWNESLKKREPWYAGVVRAMPSFKTSSYDLYLQHLPFFWKHLRFVLAFSAEQGFLRWRFTQDRAKFLALDALVKRLVPIASTQVCIAYGDWSRRDGI